MPIIVGYDSYFLISFTAENVKGNHCVRLYDTDLTLIDSLHSQASIASLFMNESYIIIFYGENFNECCHVFNYKLEKLFTFGQKIHADQGFYLAKSVMSRQVNLIYFSVEFFKNV